MNPLENLGKFLDNNTPQSPVSKSASALDVLKILSKTRKTEVRLPVLRVNAIVSPFIGAEDLYMQTLKVSGASFHRYVDELLFKQTEFMGIVFSDFNDFITNISPIDKQVLIVGLLQATFTELPEKVITCPKCGQPDSYKFKPEELIHDDSYLKEWDKDEDVADFEISSKITDNIEVVYQMPTEAKKLEVLNYTSSSQMRNNLEKHNEVFSLLDLMCIYIKRIIITPEDKTQQVIILEDLMEDIIPTVKGMPLDLQTLLIADPTIDEFTVFNPYYYFNIQCSVPTCSHQFKWDEVKPEQDFFRKALSIYNS